LAPISPIKNNASSDYQNVIKFCQLPDNLKNSKTHEDLFSRANDFCNHCHKQIKDQDAIDILDKLADERCIPAPTFIEQVCDGLKYPSLADVLADANLLTVNSCL